MIFCYCLNFVHFDQSCWCSVDAPSCELTSSRSLKTFRFVSTLEDKHSTASEQSRMWWRLSQQHCVVLGSALEFFFNVFITWDEIFNSFQSWMFTGLQVGEWTVARALNVNFLFFDNSLHCYALRSEIKFCNLMLYYI